MTPPVIKTASALAERIRALHRETTKQAGVGETDSRKDGSPEAPLTDGDDPSKIRVPADSKPQNHDGMPQANASITKDTNPAGAGEGVPPVGRTVAPDGLSDKVAAAIAGLKGLATPATPAVAAATKTADAAEFPADFYVKIAQTLLATRDGTDLVTGYLQKQAGVEAAMQLVGEVNAHTVKVAAWRDAQVEQLKQANAVLQDDALALGSMLKGASQAEIAEVEALAGLHLANMQKIAAADTKGEGLVEFYKQGAMDGAAMADPAAAGGAAPPPGAPPSLPGAEGALPMDQLAGILQQMVASGELPQEDAQQIVQILMKDQQAAAGGAPGGGAPPAGGPPAGGAEAPPPPAKEDKKEPDGDEKSAAFLIGLVSSALNA